MLVERKELAEKLGIAVKVLRWLVYRPGASLRYIHKEDGRRMFDEDEVVELLKEGNKRRQV